MTSLRHRMTVAALVLLAAGLSACAGDPTSPLADAPTDLIAADVDSTKRIPTIPWFDVQSTAIPTIPWH